MAEPDNGTGRPAGTLSGMASHPSPTDGPRLLLPALGTLTSGRGRVGFGGPPRSVQVVVREQHPGVAETWALLARTIVAVPWSLPDRPPVI